MTAPKPVKTQPFFKGIKIDKEKDEPKKDKKQEVGKAVVEVKQQKTIKIAPNKKKKLGYILRKSIMGMHIEDGPYSGAPVKKICEEKGKMWAQLTSGRLLLIREVRDVRKKRKGIMGLLYTESICLAP